MHLDNSISIGNLLMAASIVVGWIYQIGVMRTELRTLAGRLVEHTDDDRHRFEDIGRRFDHLDGALDEERDRAEQRDQRQRERVNGLVEALHNVAVEQARRT